MTSQNGSTPTDGRTPEPLDALLRKYRAALDRHDYATTHGYLVGIIQGLAEMPAGEMIRSPGWATLKQMAREVAR